VTCRELADFLMNYLDGELAGDVRERFEDHLTRCPNCVKYLSAYEKTSELSRKALAALEADPEKPATGAGAPDELIRAILAARPR
jgi:anti-sigma factor RsiW